MERAPVVGHWTGGRIQVPPEADVGGVPPLLGAQFPLRPILARTPPHAHGVGAQVAPCTGEQGGWGREPIPRRLRRHGGTPLSAVGSSDADCRDAALLLP